MWKQALTYMLQRFFVFFDYEPKPGRTVTCGNCKVIGHMRTNQECPMWSPEEVGYYTTTIAQT